MPDTPTIDLDAEAILFDGHWYTRDDLARRIKAMLDAGDFNVTRPSTALEQLTQVMASVRTVAFRATPDIVEALNRSAATHGKTVGNRIRELLLVGLTGAGGGVAILPQAEPAPSPAPAPPPIKPIAAPAGGGGGGGGPPGSGGGGVLAGPGALRSAGLSKTASSPAIPVIDPNGPSVVVEPALQEEGAIELTERKKGDETPAAESRWFKS
jgi:hypothetical protein